MNIGFGIHNYSATHFKLPPPVVCDKNGRPLYSWRVALLPFVEQQSLHKRFKLDEPWDSPHNTALLKPTPSCYYIGGPPDDPPGTTRYQAFVGPGSAFERPGLFWNDFPHGPGKTLLVVEAGEPVPWTKPVDLVYDPNGPLPPLGAGFTKATYFLCREIARSPAFNACFADGSVRLIRTTTDEQVLRSLITRDAGDKVNLSDLD
jgi:hypothetical protein